ncbi:MAG: KAP family NTPase [Nitrospiraceae bacterium]|nr:KAP family NTPase [Nitrospiraceae bacterium]
MLLSDNETKVDLLNNEAIATTIVKLLRERPDHPVTVGVHGDWGAGKSSVLEMIEASLEGTKDVLCIKFNGWRFQGFEDAKIALIEGIVTELINKRPALTKTAAAVKDIFKRIDWLKVAKAGGGLALAAHGILLPGQIDAIMGALTQAGKDPEKIGAAIEDAKSFLKPAEVRNIPEDISEFRKAFDALLKEAGITQLVVLVDDLDRCLPDIAIETLEAIRLFVFTSRTAFIVAADEAMIEYAVRKHFPDLPDSTGPQTYARNYLEKLIQVPFRIPPLGEMETRIYVTLLLVGAELGEADPEFTKLIGVARERLKKPWESSPIDAETIRITLGGKAGKAQTALTLADQIGPSLASGTKGNPRQIKRFLNTLILRQRTAEARGFGKDVNLPVLAKLMLAECFLPRLFDQIAMSAAASSNGVCEELSQLEAVSAETEGAPIAAKEPMVKRQSTPEDKKTPDLKVVSQPEKPLLAEWISLKVVQSWSSIEPPLSGIDLRPYLFVTKDKKDYFGSATALGHLATVAERLFGSKLSVQTLEPDLKRLAPLEAARLFEAVRNRIISGATFDKEPAGVPGLTVLVKSHPELQDNLVDFLEGLPAEKLGPWAVAGWDTVVSHAATAARLAKLLDGWSKIGNNPVLKTAATGVKQLPRVNR